MGLENIDSKSNVDNSNVFFFSMNVMDFFQCCIIVTNDNI